MSVLQELEQASSAAIQRAGGSVVRIGRGWGRGSGVVVGDGVVLTNAHNLRGEETTITFADGRVATGRMAGADVDGDLAVVTVDTSGAPPVTWSPGDVAPRVGAAVFAMANTGTRGLRATFGMVSAVGQAFRGPRGRRVTGSVEHTAPMGRGSSGGPIVDGEGRLLGINTNRLGDGFYLAIPADAELKARVDALGRGESPRRRSLGVALAPPRAARHLRRAVGLPDRDGLLVRGVEDDSPAGRAGLRTGDLIVEAAGQPVTTTDALFAALDAVPDDGSLALTVVRGVEEVSVSVTFGADATRQEGTA